MQLQWNRFLAGLGVFFQGMGVLTSVPRIKRYVVFPFLIFVGIFVLGVVGGWHWVPQASQWLISLIQSGTGVSGWFAEIMVSAMVWIFYLTLLFILIFVFASIIASPFHSMMADRILLHDGVLQESSWSFRTFFRRTWTMFYASLIKSFWFLGLGIVLAVLGLIPGIQPIALIGFALMIAFDCMDYAFETTSYSFAKRVRFFLTHFPMFLGMGLIIMLFFLVPGFLFLFYPILVAGASRLFTQQLKNEHQTL